MRTTSARLVLIWSVSVMAGCGSSGSTNPDGGGSGGSGDGGPGTGGNKDGAVDQMFNGDVDSGGKPGPAPFALKGPNGDPNSSTTPELTWEVAAGAASYTVEIATAATFGAATVVMKAGLGTASFFPPAGLKEGVIYFWRVTAINDDGMTVASNAPQWFSASVSAGPSPHGIAVTPDGMRAVVANDVMPGAVTLVDLTTFTTQSITLMGHAGQVAISPDGMRALVTEGTPNNLAVIDLAGKTLAGVVTPPCVSTTLAGIAIKRDGSAALMPDFGTGCIKDVLDVIPLPGMAIASTIDLASSASAFAVAITPDGSAALVTRGEIITSIARVALDASGTVTPIPGVTASFGVAITPDGKQALVTSGQTGTIKVISLTSNTVTGTIMFGSNRDIGNVAIAPDGKSAVVVGDFKTAILSLTDNSVVATPSFTGRSVAITPDGNRALVTGAGPNGRLYVLKLP